MIDKCYIFFSVQIISTGLLLLSDIFVNCTMASGPLLKRLREAAAFEGFF